jgi:aminoglycoside 6'-N-acetyltransferase I
MPNNLLMDWFGIRSPWRLRKNSSLRAYSVWMENLVVRRAELEDVPELAKMCHCLWPKASVAEHAKELAALFADNLPGPLPATVFLAEELDGRVVGFIEVDLRSHADGCDPSRPVAYIEGWYVLPAHRRRQVGARLVAAAEDWARNEGCTEMASDAWQDALDSQRAHEALGFEVVDRCIHYRKNL